MNIIVNFNKPFGISSHDALTGVKKLFKVRKAGHAGTLDPAATGVLLICLNEATKITNYLSDLDKEYIVTAKLGESSDTYDSEGIITKRAENFSVSSDDIESVIRKFLGEIEQVPPMHSAIKLSGKPLYKLARKGIEVERKPRKINIKSIEVLEFVHPCLTLRVSCSKGTYIRSLCNDIGEALGTGAYVIALKRTRIGGFEIEDSAGLDDLPTPPTPHLAKGGTEGGCALHSIDSALAHLPEIKLEGNDLKRAIHGNPVIIGPELDLSPVACHLSPLFVRLKDQAGKLLGIGKVSGNSIKIERLLNL